MDVQRAIAALEAAWDVDGCLAALREGHFDHVAADEFLRLLKSIELPSQVDLPRRWCRFRGNYGYKWHGGRRWRGRGRAQVARSN